MLRKENIVLDLIQNYKIAIQDRAFLRVVIGSTCIFAAGFSFKQLYWCTTFRNIQSNKHWGL